MFVCVVLKCIYACVAFRDPCCMVSSIDFITSIYCVVCLRGGEP